MLQRNCYINYFNQTNTLIKIDNYFLSQIIINNAIIFLLTPILKLTDNLNLQSSFIKYNIKFYKSVSYRFFYNNFFIKWARIIFKGKSYRVRNFKHNNKFTFNFGYSHWTRFKLLTRWQCFKRRRQNHLIFTYNLKDFEYFVRFFPYIRFMNRYTLRGLRLKKQFIIRRFGKISQHISSLH